MAYDLDLDNAKLAEDQAFRRLHEMPDRATATTRIGDCFSRPGFAKNWPPCNFGLLQQNRHISDVPACPRHVRYRGYFGSQMLTCVGLACPALRTLENRARSAPSRSHGSTPPLHIAFGGLTVSPCYRPNLGDAPAPTRTARRQSSAHVSARIILLSRRCRQRRCGGL
jgi:hypothetical protein